MFPNKLYIVYESVKINDGETIILGIFKDEKNAEKFREHELKVREERGRRFRWDVYTVEAVTDIDI